MKRICYILLAAAFLAAGCTKEDNGGPIEELQIGIDNVLTKVALGTESSGEFDLLWSDGDEVAVTGDAGSSIFRLKSGAGTTNGVFEYKSGATGQTRITDVVYPASGASNVPATQTYQSCTFDPSALTLAYHNQASTSATKILLGSESSVLCFQMKGNDKLNNIAVTFKNGKTYTLKTLNAPMLNESKSAPFYIVVPSQKSDRVDIKFTSASGTMHRSLLSKSFVSGKVHRFKPLEFKADKKFRIMSYNIGQCSQGGNSRWRALSRMDQSTFNNPVQPNNLICIDYIFLWKGGPDVNVTKTEVCKSVQCCTITDASDHFPIYVDVTVGNSSLPLLEEGLSLGSYNVVSENYQ